MERFKQTWYKVPAAVRKPLTFMIGFAVIGAGLVMLVFPGPGWAAIFVGFAILATEFAFAERVRDWLISILKQLIAYLEQQWQRIKKHKN